MSFDIRGWNFDIDRFIDPFVPAPRWHLVPRPIAHFLGYRDTPNKPLGNVLTAFWSLIGAFCGVALVAEVSKRVPSIVARDAPKVVGSFGAAAVIEFYAIESPFAQPRNAFISQMFACLIGVGISKLLALNPHAEEYTALGGSPRLWPYHGSHGPHRHCTPAGGCNGLTSCHQFSNSWTWLVFVPGHAAWDNADADYGLNCQ
ncbi:hypothetical protein N7448_000285 [Penicillium atrosanguineum]|nr:hypothetical protein N7448_000285 [Penicillium atrosanguineum]